MQECFFFRLTPRAEELEGKVSVCKRKNEEIQRGVQYGDYKTHARVARKVLIHACVVCNMRRCLAKTVQKSHSGERVFYSGNTLSYTNRIQDKHSL